MKPYKKRNKRISVSNDNSTGNLNIYGLMRETITKVIKKIKDIEIIASK